MVRETDAHSRHIALTLTPISTLQTVHSVLFTKSPNVVTSAATAVLWTSG